jgi:DNA transformation protein
MTQKNKFVEDMVRLLSSVLGDVQVRAMFGGHSFYNEGRVFAMTAGDRLYFKADKVSSDTFKEAGSEPFTYDSHTGRPVAMSYWEAPEGTLDDPEAIKPWARLGVEAAARSAGKQKPKSK